MKKLITIMTASMLVFAMAFTGCASIGGTDEPDPTLPAITEPENTEGTAPEGTAPEATPDDGGFEADAMEYANAMLPVLDTIARSTSQYASYSLHDDYSIWNMLYLLGINYGADIEGVEVTGESTFVPAATLEAMAVALYADFTEMPELPEWNTSITFDAARNGYVLMPSDPSEDVLTIVEATQTEKGIVAGCTFGSGESIADISFLLANVDGGLFPCSVKSVTYSEPFTFTEFAVSASADLNGDGLDEVIGITLDENDTVHASVNDIEMLIEYMPYPRVYVCDIDENDGLLDLIVTGDLGSDDYDVYVLNYADGKLVMHETYGHMYGIDGKGSITVSRSIDVLGTYGTLVTLHRDSYDADFAMVGDTYEIERYEDEFEYRALVTKRDALPVTLADGTASTLPTGTKLVVTATDAKTWVDCELEDGTAVRIAITREGEGVESIIDGVPEYDWFEMIPYAG